MYNTDKSSSTGESVPKFTNTHLNPNVFQKMNVSKGHTHFVKTIDNAFAALNSRSKVCNSAMSESNVFQAQQDALNIFTNLKHIRLKGLLSRLLCFH